MNQNRYSEFFARVTQELIDHVADDMQRLSLSLLQGLPLESLLSGLDMGKVLGQLGGMPGFHGIGIGVRVPGEAAYRMLGLDRSASDQEIKRRYRDLAKRLHPDVAGEETTHLFQIVQAAYEEIAKERGWR